MADITKCDGGDCNMKETCYRFKAMPCEMWQSYFVEIPSKGIDEYGNTICEEYLKTDKLKGAKSIGIPLKIKK